MVRDPLAPDRRVEAACEALASLAALYQQVDAATAEFQSGSGLACPTGCSICCTRFVPDITEIEARFLESHVSTAGISPAGPAGPEASGSPPQGCPYYDPVAHCTVYDARPLVCRLFGFAGLRGPAGETAFSVCSRMPALADGRRTFRGREIRLLSPTDPPDMQEASMRTAAIPGGDPSETRPIHLAVLSVRETRALRDRFAWLERNRRDDGDDDNSPDAGPPELRPAA